MKTWKSAEIIELDIEDTACTEYNGGGNWGGNWGGNNGGKPWGCNNGGNWGGGNGGNRWGGFQPGDQGFNQCDNMKRKQENNYNNYNSNSLS